MSFHDSQNYHCEPARMRSMLNVHSSLARRSGSVKQNDHAPIT